MSAVPKLATARQGPTDPLVAAIVAGVVAALQEKLPASKPKRLLTTEDAADYLGFTEDAIRHMVAANALPVVRIGERSIRFDITDLNKFIEERKR
jgi:excisionase family DNA binding protein